MSTSDHTCSTIKSRLRQFKFREVLSEDISSKTIWILGSICNKNDTSDVVPGENAAVLTLERLAFNEEKMTECGKHGLNNQTTSAFETIKLDSGEQNDVYSWATGFIDSSTLGPDVRVSLIFPATQKHIDKHRRQQRKLITETSDLYSSAVKPFIDAQPASRIQWVYNILTKKVEADRIVFEDPDPENGFIILPDLKWDVTNSASMYLVAIVHRKDVKSLRDLTDVHLPLLKNIRNKAKIAAQKYHVSQDKLRLYIHYQPSYYHLHVHITNVDLEGRGIAADRAHLLDTVISNIEDISADYYQRVTLAYALGSDTELWSHLQSQS
ncbi:hypothetical protein LPJ55_002741 [Coemansia sp. RSA 990]|nr:HIT-like domain-containing protein [Coemansia mojavensis]KAJ1743188.1 hypothetical protein LPJ68_001192 [Coemansia sp. RSA 1086]KAJ1872846.1 hypothetical protein LPJ55_002741 [Coemansia sp. RSA 990]KAJ2676571.1 hypothetical protein IWW42_000446 [Coemansia sp. RSA 1085]